MNESKKVYAAIHAVAADLSELGIEKGRKNQAQGFVFRGIDDVLQTLSPILKKHKLLMLPTQIERVATVTTSSTGKPMNHVSVTMEYKFVSVEDGSEQVIRMPGEGMDSGDKATSKAVSMAYKYACFQALCIPFEGCEDSDEDSPEIGKATAPGVKQDKPPAPAPKAPESPKADGFIDEKQRKAIKEASLAALKTADQVSAWFKAKGIESFGKIKASQYDTLLAEVKRAKPNGAAA
jgi:hypothetical protein